MRWKSALIVLSLCAGALGCPEEDGCFSDSECGVGLVCNRAASACVVPPAACQASCTTSTSCDGTDLDTCIKNFCGAAFLQYYRDTYGGDCETAYLALMNCDGGLSCTELERYLAEIDAEAGTAPFCQAELQAKNAAC